MWALFEAGYIRLVDHSDGMGIEPCLTRNERRTAMKKNKVMANYRRRIVRARWIWSLMTGLETRRWALFGRGALESARCTGSVRAAGGAGSPRLSGQGVGAEKARGDAAANQGQGVPSPDLL